MTAADGRCTLERLGAAACSAATAGVFYKSQESRAGRRHAALSK